MEINFDMTKRIGRQWRDQSITKSYTGNSLTTAPTIKYNPVTITQVNISNFPMKYKFRRERTEGIDRINRAFSFIKDKSNVDLVFMNPTSVFQSSEFEKFKSIRYNVDINTSFADVNWLLKQDDMIVVFHGDCNNNLNLLKYVITLKNKGCPGTVLFNEDL